MPQRPRKGMGDGVIERVLENLVLKEVVRRGGYARRENGSADSYSEFWPDEALLVLQELRP